MSREAILKDIRAALAVPTPPEHEDPGPEWPFSKSEGGDLVERFRRRFEAAGGIWHEARDESEAASICPGPGTTVTGADVAIAETGSFGILIRPGQGRLASLTSWVHVVVIRRSQFVERLEDFLAMAKTMPGSAAILITGPSRTADIEQTLTIGVHGPGQVHAVLIC